MKVVDCINTYTIAVNDGANIMITHDFRSVNNKPLVDEIADFIDGLLDGPSYLVADQFHREAVADVAFDLMQELQDINIVDNYKVVADARNNSQEELEKGTFNLEIYFKEHNCVNVTKLFFVQTNTVDVD